MSASNVPAGQASAKSTGGQKDMSVEKPFPTPAKSLFVEGGKEDWGWSSGWSGWWGWDQGAWQSPNWSKSTTSSDGQSLQRGASSFSGDSEVSADAAAVHAALRRAPTTASALDAVAEETGPEVQRDLDRVFEALDLDDAAATKPLPELGPTGSEFDTKSTLPMETQQDTQQDTLPPQLEAPHGFPEPEAHKQGENPPPPATLSQSEAPHGFPEPEAHKQEEFPPPPAALSQSEGQNPEPPAGVPVKQEATDPGPAEAIIPDLQEKWRCDKYGRPLNPGALYQKFYRSARSP